MDRCNYTTDNADTASITINVTTGSCDVNQCGINAQSGTCTQGRCTCAPNSGMTRTNIRNPNAVARRTQLYIPACRYRQFVLTSGFTPGQVMTVKNGENMSIAFRLSKDAAAAVCLGSFAPLSTVRIGRLSACPDKPLAGAAAAVVSPDVTDDVLPGAADHQHDVAAAGANAAQAEDLIFSVTCSVEEYIADVELPASAGGSVGACYRLVLKLADGTARRGFVKVTA
jgi:hypothetical protein